MAVVASVALCACAYSGPTVLGGWSNTTLQDSPNTMVFRGDGTVSWSFDRPEIGAFQLTYRVDYGASPHRLVLNGFDRGILAGRSLYGIFEFLGLDSLRMELEAGDPADRAPSLRFTDGAHVYTRTSPDSGSLRDGRSP